MPSPSLNSTHHAFIADWLCALLFAIATRLDDDADVIVRAPQLAVSDGLHALPNACILPPLLFANTVTRHPDFDITRLAEEVVMTLRVFYIIALQATGIELGTVQQFKISGLTSFAEYHNIKQSLTKAVASRRGTTQIGDREWAHYLAEISRLTALLIPHDDADLGDMPATINALLQHMEITSSDGNMPLNSLSFPSQADTAEWNPANDPIVDSGRRKARNIAPGSAQAVNLDAVTFSILRFRERSRIPMFYRPRPKHVAQKILLALPAEWLFKSW
ncbi:hypothetical protein BDZ89DRAFT_1046093 [Hymenopellis radicata]|nr:hypothetical protein BDZ89DRAFT_1046093 [Hymenopellis radicata]